MAVTTHVVPTDEDRMEYNNYVSPMTTIEKFGKNEELRGGITKPQNDLKLRGLQDRSQTEGFRLLRPRDAKRAKKAPTNKESKKKTKARKKHKSAPKPSSQRE
jgi:hypothetical protein